MAHRFVVWIPSEPYSKRAHTPVYNHATRRPAIVDPDRDRKSDVAQFIAETASLPESPLICALTLDVTFFVSLPTSISKCERQRRLAFRWAAECKKDNDNMCKIYQDALQTGPLAGKIFLDDHQICDTRLRKLWGEEPGVLIQLMELTAPPEFLEIL